MADSQTSASNHTNALTTHPAAARRWLRAEGMVVAAAALAAYLHMQGGWKLILLLLLVPDLSFAAYLAGPRVGAIGYNIAHTYAVPGVLLAGAMLSGWAANVVLVHIALIHIIHIGLDRALGYGLKSPAGFQETHLGRIGRRQ